MSKEELPVEEVDSDSTEGVEETPEEPSVPLSQYEKIKDDHLRLAADFDNYKKRAEKEKENISSVTLAYFINTLFPLIDNFEMAMSQDEISKETEAFNSLLQSILENLQLEEVGTVGESFDPSIHEAVEHTGEGDLQVVDAVLRKGYMFQGNLIRPSMVKVKSE
uniref:Protein GrpE n=1 Tax=Candidatus Actinomarina minuta TaxID=1389454 RepID=S5DVR8_9ACTN|nr:molecular chaperone GrpE (heat shock protein) [Candidatus Actinomarina minuta]